MTKNVFIVGLNDANRRKLERLRGAENLRFHGVIAPAEVYDTEIFPIPEMLRRAEAQLRAFDGPIDAVVGYMDFPVSTMLPLVCARFGLRTPSLESLLKCEHKYWSRLVQREVIGENIPQFAAFDPFDDDALRVVGEAGIGFPFFVKPIKSSGSRLGFRIDSPENFSVAIAELRAQIETISEPFNFILDQATMPEQVRAVDGRHCLAEEIIGGHQCTVEGYVDAGEVVSYGIVDSIRYPQVISFSRYQYPSRLPASIQRRMKELTRRVMEHTGFDHGAFNVEFFWDEPRDHIWLLEINTRISQSHCELFEKVDGVSHQQVTVDLALGRHPSMPSREGRYAVAAKFFHRVFLPDALVTRAPSAGELATLEATFPDATVAVQVHEGMKLSGLPEQDSYSYALAYVWIGAASTTSLLRTYGSVLRGLRLELARVDGELAGGAALALSEPIDRLT